jgi:hypothetical protein
MRLDVSINTLVGTADERVPLFEVRIGAPVPAGPVGMFAK